MKTSDKGFLLHRISYSESSLILVFYTQKQGLAKFIFKGGKTIPFPKSAIKFNREFLPFHANGITFRGFIQETLSLLLWIIAFAASMFLNVYLEPYFIDYIDSPEIRRILTIISVFVGIIFA